MSEIDNNQEFKQHIWGKCRPVFVEHSGQMCIYAETLSHWRNFNADFPHPEPEGVSDIIPHSYYSVCLKFVKMSSPENPSVDDRIQYAWYEIHTIIKGSFAGARQTILNNCSDKFFIMGRDFYYLADVTKEGVIRYKV